MNQKPKEPEKKYGCNGENPCRHGVNLPEHFYQAEKPKEGWELKIESMFSLPDYHDPNTHQNYPTKLVSINAELWVDRIKQLIRQLLQQEYQRGYEDGRKTDNQIPMGVSQWKNHGVKYGYCEFFEEKAIAEYKEKLVKEINELRNEEPDSFVLRDVVNLLNKPQENK